MPFVLDASVAASWAFPEEHGTTAARAAELLDSAIDSAIVPVLWWYEIRNVLLVNERRGRTTAANTAIFLAQLADLSIRIDPDLDQATILELARGHALTVYDAAYLALAIREQAPLATLDQRLQAAARASRISLL